MPKRRPNDTFFYDEVETGMVDGFLIDRATLAIQKCLKTKMDDEKWRELGYELNERKLIEDHPRLLRALHFGDEDYGGAIFQVVPELLGTGLRNLKAIEDYLDLPGGSSAGNQSFTQNSMTVRLSRQFRLSKSKWPPAFTMSPN